MDKKVYGNCIVYSDSDDFTDEKNVVFLCEGEDPAHEYVSLDVTVRAPRP